MRTYRFILFLSLLAYLSKAQEALPKGDSYFVRVGFNHPFNSNRFSDTYKQVYFKSGASLSAGLSHNGKRITISPAFRASYLSGNSYSSTQIFKGSTTTHSNFQIINFGGELVFFGRLDKIVSLGIGLQGGFSAYRNVSGSTVSSTFMYPTTSSSVSTNDFGSSYAGALIDLRIQPKKLGKNNYAGSFGLRFHYSVVSNEGNSIISGYYEPEVYLSLNFWNKKKAKRDSIGTIHLADTLAEKDFQYDRYDVHLPEGMSFFVQPAYSKPNNYSEADGVHQMTGTFQPGASMALGLNLVRGRLTLSPVVKYAYIHGRATGGDIQDLTVYQNMRFTSKFDIGLFSTEAIFSRMMGQQKRVLFGFGAVIGNSISQNISGTIENYTPTSYTRSEINNTYFDTFYGGGLIDLKCYLSKNVRPNCGTAIGGRLIIMNSNIPYKKTMSQFEVYLNYTFWKKRAT